MSVINSTAKISNGLKVVPASVLEHFDIGVESKDHTLATKVFQNSQLDLLGQFQANLNQVEDLTRRLSFVMAEVSHVIKNKF